jgi:hypothetical protein
MALVAEISDFVRAGMTTLVCYVRVFDEDTGEEISAHTFPVDEPVTEEVIKRRVAAFVDSIEYQTENPPNAAELQALIGKQYRKGAAGETAFVQSGPTNLDELGDLDKIETTEFTARPERRMSVPRPATP